MIVVFLIGVFLAIVFYFLKDIKTVETRIAKKIDEKIAKKIGIDRMKMIVISFKSKEMDKKERFYI